MPLHTDSLQSRCSMISLVMLTSALACLAQVQMAQMASKTNTTSQTQSQEIAASSPAQATLAILETKLRSDLAVHPESAATLYRLGLVLRQENRPKESLDAYTLAAKYQKPDAVQLQSVALDYVLLNDYSDAIHWLETAQSYNPRNIDVLYSLARCYYTQGRYHAAEELYLRVLQIKPDHLKAEENLGLAYDAENLPDKAEPALRTAASWASKSGKDEWPFLDFGTFLLDHDRAQEALPLLQNATAIAPKCAPCHEKLGRALGKTGKPQESASELETAVELDPKNPSIHYELGRVYYSMGAQEKARAEFALSEQLRRERN